MRYKWNSVVKCIDGIVGLLAETGIEHWYPQFLSRWLSWYAINVLLDDWYFFSLFCIQHVGVKEQIKDLCLVAHCYANFVSQYSLFLELCRDMTVAMKDTATNFLDTRVNNNLSQKGVMQ